MKKGEVQKKNHTAVVIAALQLLISLLHLFLASAVEEVEGAAGGRNLGARETHPAPITRVSFQISSR